MGSIKPAIVGGSEVVWPSGASTLTVEFRPSRDLSDDANQYRLVVGELPAALSGAYVSRIDNQDVDALSGSGGAPVDIFRRDSTQNNLLFGAPSSSSPPQVTFAIGAPPGADTAFSAAFIPSVQVTRENIETAKKEQVRRKRLKRVVRKLRSRSRRRSFLSRVGKGIKSLAKGAFRRFFRMRGIDGDLLAGVDEDQLLAGIEEELEPLMGEYLGALADELDDAIEGVASSRWDEDEED